MDIIRSDNKISFLEANKEVAYVYFKKTKESVISITHTYVSDDKRGLGLASKLMEEVINYVKESNLLIIPLCSYAVKYFDKFPEYSMYLYK